MTDATQLLRTYDVSKLRRDLELLDGRGFLAQRTYTGGRPVRGTVGGWTVLPLRSPGGDPKRTDPGGPGLQGYRETPHLRDLEYVPGVLRDLGGELRSVRLMSMAPGTDVPEHTDHPYGFAVGWVRLHVPIETNDDAVLVLNGREHRWQPGHLWYGDFGLPHRLHNHGRTRRVHLVIDAYVTPALLELFPPGFRDGVPDVAVVRPERRGDRQALARYSGTLTVPRAFLGAHPSGTEPAGPDGSARDDVPARLHVMGDRLVLRLSPSAEYALVAVDDGVFRFLGWTEERTLVMRQVAGGGWSVAFRYRRGGRVQETSRSLSPAGLTVSSSSP